MKEKLKQSTIKNESPINKLESRLLQGILHTRQSHAHTNRKKKRKPKYRENNQKVLFCINCVFLGENVL